MCVTSQCLCCPLLSSSSNEGYRNWKNIGEVLRKHEDLYFEIDDRAETKVEKCPSTFRYAEKVMLKLNIVKKVLGVPSSVVKNYERLEERIKEIIEHF